MKRLTEKMIKKNENKGFILVELIVVLLVIVILLAILIPMVLDHIEDAKESAELSEARAVKVAFQTLINENYSDDGVKELIENIDYNNYGLSEKGHEEIERLLEMRIGKANRIVIDKNNILREFSYFTINGSKINYKDDKYTTEYIY